MNLVLDIEFLTGTYRGTHGSPFMEPDWPPQPDRVFSALVSAWAARGECEEERPALEWLEQQCPPDIVASDSTARTVPDVYVPPNDFKIPAKVPNKIKSKDIAVLPEKRPRQARRFPVARPDDPVMTMVWPQPPDNNTMQTLNAIAHDVGYVGHSASLTRCYFRLDDEKAESQYRRPAHRRIYSGRMKELERAHRLNPVRPDISPGATIRSTEKSAEKPNDWLVLEAVGGVVPDILATAFVCRMLRMALMSGYRRMGKGDAIPEEVSGHTLDGKPTQRPHIAIVPMSFVGYEYADGRVFGFALIPPRDVALLEIPELRMAFDEIAPYCEREERRILELQGDPLHEPLRLSPVAGETKRSLRSAPYTNSARVWASVTPIVLDRHLKGKDDEEIRTIIANACENSGLPRPDLKRIYVGKHSAVKGVPAARPLSGAPPWTRWNVPKAFASRTLVHAVIDFEHEVSGPVLLGAGRFTGLGLCRGLPRG